MKHFPLFILSVSFLFITVTGEEHISTVFSEISSTQTNNPFDITVSPQIKYVISETMQFGGNGGTTYKDDVTSYLTPTTRLVALKYGVDGSGNIESLSLRLTNNDGSYFAGPSHGGTAHGQQVVFFDKKIIKVRVYHLVSSFVRGFLFTLDDGTTVSVGGSDGDAADIPIYGQIVGLQGAAGSLCDKVGFISYTISDNPKSPVTVPLATASFGGTGGTLYTDAFTSTTANSVIVRAGAIIDGIQLSNSGVSAPQHGGNGGNAYTVALDSLSSIILNYDTGSYVQGIKFCFSTGTCSQQFGATSGSSVTITVPSDGKLVAVYGRNGNYLDRVGFIFARTG